MGGRIPPLPIYEPMACIEMTLFYPKENITFLLFVYLLKNYRIYCSILMRVHMFRLFLKYLVHEHNFLDFHEILI